MVLLSKLKNLIRWARVSRAGVGSGQFPVQQVEYLGKTGDTVVVYPFGFHANAEVDNLVFMSDVHGQAENRAAVVTSGSRPDLAAGEVAVYHPGSGSIIKMKADGDIEMAAPNVNIIGDVAISGDLTVGPLAKDFITHVHVGSPTAPVGAVSPTGVLI